MTVLLTPIFTDSSRAGGSCSPIVSSPESIMFSICCTNSSVMDTATILLNPIFASQTRIACGHTKFHVSNFTCKMLKSQA